MDHKTKHFFPAGAEQKQISHKTAFMEARNRGNTVCYGETRSIMMFTYSVSWLNVTFCVFKFKLALKRNVKSQEEDLKERFNEFNLVYVAEQKSL